MRRAGLLLGLACMGCAPVVSTSRPADPRPMTSVVVDPRETKHCERLAIGRRRADAMWVAEPAAPELAPFLADVPARVRLAARAAGMEPMLGHLLRARAEGRTEGSEVLAAMRGRAIMRLSTMEIELAALLFEADCVGDQMEAVTDELEQRSRKQEIGIAIASVVVGAASGIGAGIWDLQGDDTGPVVFGITGGTISAALGLVAFVPRRDKVLFEHERNMLEPIMTGRDPHELYPTFVFHLLTHASEPDEPTPRDEIVAAWQTLVDESVPPSRRATAHAVLFGTGGTYDADLVDVREQMFDVMESHLNAMQRDLELLYGYMGELLVEPAGVSKPVIRSAHGLESQ